MAFVVCNVSKTRPAKSFSAPRKMKIFSVNGDVWIWIKRNENYNQTNKLYRVWNWLELRTTCIIRTVGCSHLCVEMNVLTTGSESVITIRYANIIIFFCLEKVIHFVYKDEPKRRYNSYSLMILGIKLESKFHKFFFGAHCPVHRNEHYPEYTTLICITFFVFI